jgi:hypothetical protein
MTPERLNHMGDAAAFKMANHVTALKGFDPVLSAALQTSERHVIRLQRWFDSMWPKQVNFVRAYIEPFSVYNPDDLCAGLKPEDYPMVRVVAQTWAWVVRIDPIGMDTACAHLAQTCREEFAELAKEWGPEHRIYWRLRPVITTGYGEQGCGVVKLRLRCQIEGRRCDDDHVAQTDYTARMRRLAERMGEWGNKEARSQRPYMKETHDERGAKV